MHTIISSDKLFESKLTEHDFFSCSKEIYRTHTFLYSYNVISYAPFKTKKNALQFTNKKTFIKTYQNIDLIG